jgi:hypothetical protein
MPVGELDFMFRGVPKYVVVDKTGVQKHRVRTMYQINTALIPIYDENQYGLSLII